jgi:hypothetical protein
MHNQHADLSQILAEQRTSELQEQATHERLLRATRPPRRHRTSSARRWWQVLDRRAWLRTS